MTRRTRNLEGERAKLTITMDGLQALTISMRIPPMLRRGDHVSGHSLIIIITIIYFSNFLSNLILL